MEAKKNQKADVHQLRGMLFSVSLTLTLGLVVTVFEWKSAGDSGSVQLASVDIAPDELLEIPPTEQTPPPPPKIVNPQIVEVPDEEETPDMDIKIDLEIQNTSEEVPVAAVEKLEAEEVDEVFTIVEQAPEFPGGNAAFLKYLAENVKYPRNARIMGIEGRVFLKVIVGKDGTLTNPEIMKGIGGGCDEEALRIVAQSPKWKPGLQRGRAVKVSIVIPIVFKLS
ncbi:MAG: energy transducer TonB [Cyclobacteriaceae bacterium]